MPTIHVDFGPNVISFKVDEDDKKLTELLEDKNRYLSVTVEGQVRKYNKDRVVWVIPSPEPEPEAVRESPAPSKGGSRTDLSEEPEGE